LVSVLYDCHFSYLLAIYYSIWQRKCQQQKPYFFENIWLFGYRPDLGGTKKEHRRSCTLYLLFTREEGAAGIIRICRQMMHLDDQAIIQILMKEMNLPQNRAVAILSNYDHPSSNPD
ncbi:MAG: hypothetical protein II774_12180, partial [Lachnospiraceae bacterium]|nr:hypothetical protein [Lachnospiraceae bacterium]